MQRTAPNRLKLGAGEHGLASSTTDWFGLRLLPGAHTSLHNTTFRFMQEAVAFELTGEASSGGRVAAGTYFVRVEGPGFRTTRKLVLVK
jgi:hypothetical protein